MNLTRRSLLIGTGASAGAAALALAKPPAGSLLGLTRTQSATGRRVSVREYGALGNGRIDDRSAIQRAIDSVASGGGGVLYLPQGIYSVGRSDAGAFALQLRSNVRLQGDGVSTIIRLAPGAADHDGAHTLFVDHATNVGLSNLAIDGNRDMQKGSGHGLKSDGVEGLLLENVVIGNTFSYGIGFQGGTNKAIRIQTVLVHDTGADGIDFKNRLNANADIEIDNLTVKRWGLRGDKEIQAAIDCRGPIHMSNIRISEPGAEDCVGIRTRPGEVGEANGFGGHFSTLRAFSVNMGNGRAQVGVDVPARSVSVADGTVSGALRGLLVQETGFRGTAIHVSDCSQTGILVDAHGPRFDGDGAILSKCSAINCSGNGIEIDADSVQLLDCTSTGNGGQGLLIRESANATRLVGGNYSANRSLNVVNKGSNSQLAVSVS